MAILPGDTGMLGAGSHQGMPSHFLVYAGDLGRPQAQSGWGAQPAGGCGQPRACPQSLLVPLSRIPMPEVPWELGELLLGKKGN